MLLKLLILEVKIGIFFKNVIFFTVVYFKNI